MIKCNPFQSVRKKSINLTTFLNHITIYWLSVDYILLLLSQLVKIIFTLCFFFAQTSLRTKKQAIVLKSALSKFIKLSSC